MIAAPRNSPRATPGAVARSHLVVGAFPLAPRLAAGATSVPSGAASRPPAGPATIIRIPVRERRGRLAQTSATAA